MKNIYWSTTILLILFSISVFGQGRIYAPNLRAPENAESGQFPDVVLDWDAVTGQTTNITYEVQLATTEDFSDAVTFPRTSFTALTMNELNFGKNYYWRVKAYDDADPSDWSESWVFSVVYSVTVDKPSIGSEEYVNPVIEWDPVTGLKKYQLQVDTTYEWKTQDAGTTDDIFGTFSLSMDDMWMVGAGGLAQHYNGTEWTMVDVGVTDDLASVYFISTDNGYIVGEGGTVLHYNGTDWSVVDVGTTENLTGVFFADADNGWAVGEGGTILNYSSGTWTELSSPVTNDLYSVYAISATNVWACGKGKIVVHYDGTEWTGEEVGTRDWSSVWFVDANNGWVVGAGGKIMRFNGSLWFEEKSGTSKDLYAVSFNGTTGYAVGKSGTMITFIGEWQLASAGTSEGLNAVWVVDNTGLIGGDGGATAVKLGEGFNSPYSTTYQIASDLDEFQLENLLYGHSFYYRMRAIHSTDTSSWSAGREFFTESTVTLSKPSDNSEDTDLELLFEWKEYDGSNNYRFEIDDDEEFSNPFVLLSDSTSANYQTKYFGTTYYWRVNAENALDISDWSESWSLTTVNTVALDEPENGMTDVSSCPKYSWEPIVGVSGYEIRISMDENFSDPVVEYTEAPFFQCNTPLEKQTVYYWKVRATSTSDSSDFSPIWSFETEGYIGIEDEFASGSVDIYPNPAEKDFNITINSYTKDSYKISIVEITGKSIYENEVHCNTGENNFKMQLPELQKGLYFVQIQHGNKSVTKKLFVK